MKFNLFNQYTKYLFNKIIYIFKIRPIILDKKTKSISIEFYNVSYQDLKTNSYFIIIACIFFVFIFYIILKLIVWLSNSDLGEVPAIAYLYISLIFYSSIICYLLAILYSIYSTLSKIIFLKKVIIFTENSIFLKEKKFGFYCKIISLNKKNLPPLIKENSKNNIISFKYRIKLLIKCKSKKVVLIENYSETIINEIEKIYENYCKYNFVTFYTKIVDNLSYQQNS